jgi:hypothetical protein
MCKSPAPFFGPGFFRLLGARSCAPALTGCPVAVLARFLVANDPGIDMGVYSNSSEVAAERCITTPVFQGAVVRLRVA